MAKQQLPEATARGVLMIIRDCRISEVVDQVLGTECVVPKDLGASAAAGLPTSDTTEA